MADSKILRWSEHELVSTTGVKIYLDVFYELLGRFSSIAGTALNVLTVFEREVIRYALRLNRPFRSRDACYCLQLKEESTRHVLRKLMEKKLIKPVSNGILRHYEYEIEDKARKYML